MNFGRTYPVRGNARVNKQLGNYHHCSVTAWIFRCCVDKTSFNYFSKVINRFQLNKLSGFYFHHTIFAVKY